MRTKLIAAVSLCLALDGCGRFASEEDRIAEKLSLSREQVVGLRAKKSLSNRLLLEMDKKEVNDILRELRPDLPELRAAFRNLQLGANKRLIPPGTIIRSLLAVQRMREQTRAAFAGGIGVGLMRHPGMRLPAPPPNPVPEAKDWIPLGPGNVGGRTRSILVDPANPNRIWLGSLGGGIWKSENGGARFDPVDEFMGNLAICCMAMDPTDSGTIYAGTGEGFYNGDAIPGAGIFWISKQTGGKWKAITETNKPEMRFLTRIAVSADGKVVLAAGHNGKPFDSGHASGIFRSEKADRSDWTSVSTEEMADLKFHPSNSMLAVAGGWGAAWYSTDGGRNWLAAGHQDPWTGRVEVTYVRSANRPDNPNTVYALVDTNGGEIWKSTDGGKLYRKQTASLSIARATILGEQGYYDNSIWAWSGGQGKSDLVMAGGINLWRSTDGAQSFTDISDWTNPKSVHADHHAIVADPNFDGQTDKTMYFGNDGGVYRTMDVLSVGSDRERISGWESLNSTYATTLFMGGSANSASQTIVAGAQDNGTLRLPKGGGMNGWQVASEGDGGRVFADPTSSTRFFGEYVLLDLIRMDTDGAKDLSGIRGWTASGPVWKADQYVLPDARAAFQRQQTANFYAPFALDLRNPKQIFAGGASLWRTDNADTAVNDSVGPTWTAVKDPLPGSNPVDSTISAVAIMPGNSDAVWVGYNDGRIFATQNATIQNRKPAWQDMDPTGKLPRGRMCTRIVFDNKNSLRIYVTFAGYSKDNIWTSSTGGSDWRSVNANLSEMPILALTIHPADNRILYLGSDLGVFVSLNKGVSWSPANNGPANVSVQELFWMGETLIAATHGRGVFMTDLKLSQN